MSQLEAQKLSGKPYEYNLEATEALLQNETADPDVLMHLANTFAFCDKQSILKELMNERNMNWVNANQEAEKLYNRIQALRPQLREFLDFCQSDLVQKSRGIIKKIGQGETIPEQTVENIIAELKQHIQKRKQEQKSTNRFEALILDFEQKATANKARIATESTTAPCP